MAGSLSANHIAGAGGGYEPQRTNNWFLYLNGVAGADQITLSVASAFLPTEENEEFSINYGNMEVHVAGNIKYEAGDIVVRDYLDIDMYNTLRAWKATVADPAAGTVGFAKDYKKTARIVLVAPDNSSTREFQLLGLWPTKLSASGLSYATAAQLQITMHLRYDLALKA